MRARRLAPIALAFLAALGMSAAALAAPALTTTRIASGLSNPLYVASPPGDNDRLFIVEQHTGNIKIYNKATGAVNATPFLTVGGLSAGGEQGLLGLAFHPDYATNGYFFVNYTDAAGNTHVTRYQVSVNPNIANAASAATLFTLAQPYSNHNGGWLGFGPNDGYLYVSTGDGGSGYDPENRAQNLTQPLGKILRVDVDCTTLGNYGIPATNPFDAPNDERIWAYGLRNPWRNSFDRANGNLYIGDVGQDTAEEVDFQSASSTGGENYGWRIKEGTHLTGLGSTAGLTLVDPIHEYLHPPGIAVTGGYVYRGGRYAFLDGTYFFGDYGIGKIWSFTYSGGTLSNFADRTAELVPDCGTINLISSFGEDASGELYIVDLDGEVFRIDALLTPGDANGDGNVDGGDLAIWQQNYDPLGLQSATNSFFNGDWNHDGRINGGDFALWQQNFAPLGYSSFSLSESATLEAVPEPTTLGLLLVSAVAVGLARRRKRCISFCLLLITALGAGIPAFAAPAKNVILLIGDGMGPAHVDAASMYLGAALSFESFPHPGTVTTYSADSAITDSAAAATAIATGVKVNNGVISVALPGDGHELPTVLEYYRNAGKTTGLVTTSYMTDATPAGFGAHETSRSNTSNIATDYLTQTRPNVFMGGGGNGLSTSAAASAGYATFSTLAGMNALPNSTPYASGQFGSGQMPYEYDGVGSYPHLSQMTVKALQMLGGDGDGFFVMVEGGNIDHAAHNHDLVRDVYETVEFDCAVRQAMLWAAGRTDTLVLVTADHETGGLAITQNNGAGNLPTVSWTASGHTATNVPIYAWGFGSQRVSGTLNNTDIAGILKWSAETGDANGDGKVDGGDLAIWQQNYDPLGLQSATNSFFNGDWNNDRRIDGGDLALWRQHYAPLGYSSLALSESLSLIESVELNAIPEPGTLLLAATGAMGMGWFIRRAVNTSRSGARRR